MAILPNKKTEKDTRKTYWNRFHKLIPNNVRVLFWIIFAWWLLVHGDILRHTWRIVGPLIIKSGIMHGPFYAPYMETIRVDNQP